MASIADILIAKGNAGARGVSEKGNIYANLIGNLGSLPGQFLQDQRAARIEDARAQESQARTAIAKGQLEQQNREFDAQQQGMQAQSRVDAVLGSGVYDDAGNIDLAKVQERAAQTDPSLVPHAVAAAQKLNEHTAAYRKTMTEADDAAMRLNEKKATAVADIADQLASGPNGIDAGNYQLAIGTLAKNKVIDPRQAEEWLQADTPEAMAANVAAMRMGAKAPELKEVDPRKQLIDPRTLKVVREAQPEKLTFQKPETYTVNGRPTLVQRGSDGQIYDMRQRPIDPAATIDPDRSLTPYQEQELGIQRTREAREAAKAGAGAEPIGVKSEAKMTAGGVPYVDLSKFKGKDYSQAQREAKEAGVFAASASEADALDQINIARANMADVNRIIAKLPESGLSPMRLLNRAEAATGIGDQDITTMRTNTDAAIQAMRAVAGSKGLRLSKDIIEQSIKNNIPAPGDTQTIAKEKARKFNEFLDNQERTILGPHAAATPAAPTGKIRARDPQGVLHEAAAGTALPAGWKAE